MKDSAVDCMNYAKEAEYAFEKVRFHLGTKNFEYTILPASHHTIQRSTRGSRF